MRQFLFAALLLSCAVYSANIVNEADTTGSLVRKQHFVVQKDSPRHAPEEEDEEDIQPPPDSKRKEKRSDKNTKESSASKSTSKSVSSGKEAASAAARKDDNDDEEPEEPVSTPKVEQRPDEAEEEKTENKSTDDNDDAEEVEEKSEKPSKEVDAAEEDAAEAEQPPKTEPSQAVEESEDSDTDKKEVEVDDVRKQEEDEAKQDEESSNARDSNKKDENASDGNDNDDDDDDDDADEPKSSDDSSSQQNKDDKKDAKKDDDDDDDEPALGSEAAGVEVDPSKSYPVNVGTMPSGFDVIASGILTPNWDASGSANNAASASRPNVTVIDSSISTTVFFVTSMVTDDEDDFRLQKPFATAVVSGNDDDDNSRNQPDDEGAQARVSVSWDSRDFVVPIPNKETPRPLRFSVQYECLADDVLVPIRVMLQFLEFRAGASKAAIGDDKSKKAPASPLLSRKTIEISYFKSCKKAEAKNINTFETGFNVGTTRGDADVVKDGESLPAYTLTANRSESFTTFSADQDYATFYVTPPFEGFKLARTVMLALNDSVLDMRLEGVFAGSVVELAKNETRAMKIQFQCKQAGASVVSLAFRHVDDAEFYVEFSFEKVCKGGTHAAGGVDRAGFHIGFEPGTADIVQNGLTTKPYELVTRSEGPIDRPVIPASTDLVTFYLTLPDSKDSKNMTFLAPIVRPFEENYTDPTGVFIMSPHIEPNDDKEVSKWALDFNCATKVSAVQDVVVSIPFLTPSGIRRMITFVLRKECPANETAVETTVAKEPQIMGFNIGRSLRAPALFVTNGRVRKNFHPKSNDNALSTMDEDTPFINMLLSLHNGPERTASNDTEIYDHVVLGPPSISSTRNIASPALTGDASDGCRLDEKNPRCHLAVTFHCKANDASTFILSFPVLYPETRRNTPVQIAWVKRCSLTPDGVISGLGGVSIQGFTISSTVPSESGRESTLGDVVLNGFPTREYYGQQHVENPKWKVVPASEPAVSYYLQYSLDSLPEGAMTNEDVGSDVQFQAPLVFAHKSLSRPLLSGPASQGGRLRLGEHMELGLTFGCKFAGLEVVTIVIPLLPHGKISFTVPKMCSGATAPTGRIISGLSIGTEKGGDDIVKDGLTQPGSTMAEFRRREGSFSSVGESSVELWISKKGDKTKALPPVVFSFPTGMASPTIEHELKVVDRKKGQYLLELSEEPSKLTIHFNCNWGGSTGITFGMQTVDGGRVTFTWEKVCPNLFDEDDIYKSAIGDGNLEPDPFDELDFPEYPGLDGEDEVEPELEPEEEVQYQIGNGSNLTDGVEYPYMPYPPEKDDDIYDINAFLNDPLSEWYDDPRINPDPFADTTTSTGFVNVGTNPDTVTGLVDVIERNSVKPGYQLSQKGEGLDQERYTIVEANRKSSKFYLSVPDKSQAIDVIKVRAAPGKNNQPIVQVQTSGSAASGGTIREKDQPQALELTYTCVGRGVVPIVVEIPLIPPNLGSASFRVVKICGTFTAPQQFYWTASRIIFAIAGVAFLVVGYLAFKYGGKSRNSATKSTTTKKSVLPTREVENAWDADAAVVQIDQE